MTPHEEVYQNETARAYDRGLLVGIGLFFLVVVAIIFVDLSPEQVPYVFFIIGVVVALLSGYIVFLRRVEGVRIRYKAQQAADASIRATHSLFMEVYQHSPVPYLLIDKGGVITSLNTAAVRLFGRAEMVGESVFEYLTCEHDGHLDIVLDKFSRGVSTSAEEMIVRQHDGALAWTLLSLHSFTDSRGMALGLMTLVDMTKLKEVDRAKSEFVSLASHQLRTPIAGMRWNAELLYGGGAGLTPEQNVQAQRLLKSINRLSALVDDFLNVSRFELGTRRPTYASLALKAFFGELIAEQEPVFSNKNISVVPPEFPEDVVRVTDESLLRMVVGNLFVNAIKYTPAGGTVTFGIRLLTDTMEITVADTGIGIAPDEQARLFTKMFRASNAQRLITDGTGLGLYIAAEAAKVLGGHITVVSALNLGTTFTVILPTEG